MDMAILGEELSNLKRSWIHHTGLQIATLLVLVASFSVVSFVLIFMLNLQNVLSSWGESVRVTAYIKDSVSAEQVESLRAAIALLPETSKIELIDKKAATQAFKLQMASYAPSLLNDSEFANPFPASFVVTLKSGLHGEADISRLEKFAQKIRSFDGVEDISYGQNWVNNFSHLVEGISKSGVTLIIILLSGSLLVISNSIRMSIATRKEEIEILELVGATSQMIRSPFIFEAALMGLIAMILALTTNYVLYLWGIDFIKENLSFARISDQIIFLKPMLLIGLVLCGPIWGALSSYFTIARMNSGWSAAEGKSH
jgi:cell division transport system permease protein